MDEVLTPRLAARFERVLDADEQGAARAANRGRDDRLGPGLFERAMRTATPAPAIATSVRVGGDPAAMRALAVAALGRGIEILIGGEARGGGARAGAAIGADASARLAELAAATPSMAALLDGAIALCTELAAGAGSDAVLAWFVRVGPVIDLRLARLALGVIATVPEPHGDERPRTAALGETLATARAAIDKRRRALAELARLRAARDATIGSDAAAARAATTAAIEAELASSLRAIEATRTRDHATVDAWLEQERPRVEHAARSAHDAALIAAEQARSAELEAAHAERLTELAAQHQAAMAVIVRATATHAAALADRNAEIDEQRARWERRLDASQRIEERAIRAQVVEQELSSHTGALDAAGMRAAAIEEHARRERDHEIAAAEEAEATANLRADLRHQARQREAALAHGTAERIAALELTRALDALVRTTATRRDRIERDAATAIREARARAAHRRAHDVDAAADAAAKTRASEIDRQLAELERAARGGHA